MAKNDTSSQSLLDLDLDQLMAIAVTSVAKKSQPLRDTASAVFIITQEDIQNSGITNIPDALRLAPGLQVARIDANKFAISSRGFNSRFSNKLLVMIDGRSVYVPSYSGVYWDAQDVMFEDIDRIEVIRGPGAAIWGANAVNGVINIITKKSVDTLGGHVSIHAGKEESLTVNLRYGKVLSEGLTGRAYLKYKDIDSSYSPGLMRNAGDHWDSLRGGFRLDYQNGRDDISFQGDAYESNINQVLGAIWFDPFDPNNVPPYVGTNLADKATSEGANVLAKWQRTLSPDNIISLQGYIDHVDREEVFLGHHNDTIDIELNHQLRFESGSELLWGLHYRRVKDGFTNSFQISLTPEERATELYSIFAQFDIDITSHTRLTVGAKLEDNFYTGMEFQPNLRLMYKPDHKQRFWGAISRAVRTPSRIEDSSRIINAVLPFSQPLPLYLQGNADFKSEDLTAFELGYRMQDSTTLFYDVSVFYNEYENLVTFETTDFLFLGDTIIPTRFEFGNLISATSFGLEASVTWWPKEWWQVRSNYSFVEVSTQRDALSNDVFFDRVYEGGSPRHQLSVSSNTDLNNHWSLNTTLFYVDDLKNSSLSTESGQIPDYIDINIGVRWQWSEQLELAVFAQHILNNRRAEFIAENYSIPTEVERAFFVRLRRKF